MNERKRILIIDDDATTVTLLGHIFKKAGYGVDIARDGYEGIRKAGEFKPHIILCDIILPKLDGFSCCRELLKKYPQCPIIIISAKSGMEENFLAMGIKVLLGKPLD